MRKNEDVTNEIVQRELQGDVVPFIEAHLDTDCYRFSECQDLDLKDTSVWSCGAGYTYMGYDRSVCKSLGVSNHIFTMHLS